MLNEHISIWSGKIEVYLGDHIIIHEVLPDWILLEGKLNLSLHAEQSLDYDPECPCTKLHFMLCYWFFLLLNFEPIRLKWTIKEEIRSYTSAIYVSYVGQLYNL